MTTPTPEKRSGEPRDVFIHFLMGVHGFTRQGESAETQQCINEAVKWFDSLMSERPTPQKDTTPDIEAVIEAGVEEFMEGLPHLSEIVVDVGGDSDTIDVQELIEDRFRTFAHRIAESVGEKLRFHIANMAEPLPSANDHKEYARGKREGVELARKHLLQALSPTSDNPTNHE